MTHFFQKLESRSKETNSFLCIGLDPRTEDVEDFCARSDFQQHLSKHASPSDDTGATSVKLYVYCAWLLDQTVGYACCVKPNLAFFLAHGSEGIKALERVCNLLKQLQVPIILDAKFGDVSSTMRYYAAFAFKTLGVDACTVNTFLGTDVVEAVLSNHQNANVPSLFVLARCSNQSAAQFQGSEFANGKLVFLEVISKCQSYLQANDALGACGYVVGATSTEAITEIRNRFPDVYLLIPGVGAQGGDAIEVVKAAKSKFIVTISRAIASDANPRAAALHWRSLLNEAYNDINI